MLTCSHISCSQGRCSAKILLQFSLTCSESVKYMAARLSMELSVKSSSSEPCTSQVLDFNECPWTSVQFRVDEQKVETFIAFDRLYLDQVTLSV